MKNARKRQSSRGWETGEDEKGNGASGGRSRGGGQGRFLSSRRVERWPRRRPARITAPRVSRNPGLYASVASGAHDSGALSPLLRLPRESVRGADARPAGAARQAPGEASPARRPRKPTYVLVHSGPSSDPGTENEFQQVVTRPGGSCAHAVQVLCRYLRRGPSPFVPLARASFATILHRQLGPHCFSAISCHLGAPGTLTDRFSSGRVEPSR